MKFFKSKRKPQASETGWWKTPESVAMPEEYLKALAAEKRSLPEIFNSQAMVIWDRRPAGGSSREKSGGDDRSFPII